MNIRLQISALIVSLTSQNRVDQNTNYIFYSYNFSLSVNNKLKFFISNCLQSEVVLDSSFISIFVIFYVMLFFICYNFFLSAMQIEFFHFQLFTLWFNRKQTEVVLDSSFISFFVIFPPFKLAQSEKQSNCACALLIDTIKQGLNFFSSYMQIANAQDHH